MTEPKWELIEELEDKEGRLIGPLDMTGWYIPEIINLRGGNLVWAWFASSSKAGTQIKRVSPNELEMKDILEGFINLHEEEDKRILNFARKWGPLYLCEHGLPARHMKGNCLPLGKWIGLNGRDYESIEGWKEYSKRAHELLNEAIKIYQEMENKRLDYKLVNRQVIVAIRVQSWLDQAGVNVEFFWSANKHRIKLGAHSLFGALSVQLLTLISKTRGLAICSNCGEIYEPRRIPRDDQNNYCDKRDCKKKAAWRNAKKRQRAR